MSTPVVTNLLLWIHLMALVMGVGAGLAMSQVGPRLIAAAPNQRTTWWPLVRVYSRIAVAGVILLLITGTLLLWLKYGGDIGLNGWFKVKIALVFLLVVSIGMGRCGSARLQRGDEGGGKLMRIAGPLTMLTATAIVFAAVFAFN